MSGEASYTTEQWVAWLAARVGYALRRAQREVKEPQLRTVFKCGDQLLLALGEVLQPRPSDTLQQNLARARPDAGTVIDLLANLAAPRSSQWPTQTTPIKRSQAETQHGDKPPRQERRSLSNALRAAQCKAKERAINAFTGGVLITEAIPARQLRLQSQAARDLQKWWRNRLLSSQHQSRALRAGAPTWESWRQHAERIQRWWRCSALRDRWHQQAKRSSGSNNPTARWQGDGSIVTDTVELRKPTCIDGLVPCTETRKLTCIDRRGQCAEVCRGGNVRRASRMDLHDLCTVACRGEVSITASVDTGSATHAHRCAQEPLVDEKQSPPETQSKEAGRESIGSCTRYVRVASMRWEKLSQCTDNSGYGSIALQCNYHPDTVYMIKCSVRRWRRSSCRHKHRTRVWSSRRWDVVKGDAAQAVSCKPNQRERDATWKGSQQVSTFSHICRVPAKAVVQEGCPATQTRLDTSAASAGSGQPQWLRDRALAFWEAQGMAVDGTAASAARRQAFMDWTAQL